MRASKAVAERPGIKTLLHVHTNYSFDSDISLDRLIQACRAERIGCVSITDHDTIEGALAMQARCRNDADLRVIVGEEVTTRDGHLIGLFLTRHIEPGMSARQTALAIRAQGGLVLAPHPFVKMLSCGLNDAMDDILDLLDAVEVNNAQNFLAKPDRLAGRFATEHGLPKYVGADSHWQVSIVPCHQTMTDFSTPEEFLTSLSAAHLTRGRHPLYFFAGAAYRMARYVAGLPLPAGFGANYRAPETATQPAAATGLSQV